VLAVPPPLVHAAAKIATPATMAGNLDLDLILKLLL
jgi:hypothetical protein